ncbi:ATP-binding protein [Streptomyces avermitilis]
MTAPLPPGERPTLGSIAPFPLVTAVAAGIAVAGAVFAAPDSVRAPLAWGGAAAVLLLCTAVALAAHGMRAAKLARGRLEAVTQDAGRLLQERARLAEDFSQERGRLTDGFIEERARLTEDFARERVRLTDEFAQERARLTGEFDQERTRRTEEFDRERDELTTDYTRERDKLTADFTGERDRLTADVTRLTADVARLTEENARLAERARHAAGNRAAAVSVTGNVAGRMQALATGMLADLRGMEERHADEEVLTDLLYLDHRTAQAGRLADSVAVLAGARSGRRWARPIVMESILRGAMGRIGGYQRVRVHSSSEAAVAGHAAEGVMHALAELLDNAANFSPPTAEVHVYVEEVPAGVIVSVEDSGLVMSDVQLRRAERAVSGESSDLGGLTGTRLGLAVVGRLARKHGLKVSFRPSARGGTGVLVLIPQDILSLPAVPAVSPAPAPAPAPTPAQPVTAAVAPTAAAATVADPTVATSTDATTPDAPPVATPPAVAPSRPLPSYAAARSPEDLDPDPVPTHESPERGGSDTGGLPKRRRGRALAEAERGRPHATGRTEREPRTADDAKARVARFSSFRQAVRGTMPDQAAVQGTTTDPTPEAAPVQDRAQARAENRAENRDQDRARAESEGPDQAEDRNRDRDRDQAEAKDRHRDQAKAENPHPTKPAPPTTPPAPVRATAPAAPVQDPASATPTQSQPHPQRHSHAHPEGDTTS